MYSFAIMKANFVAFFSLFFKILTMHLLKIHRNNFEFFINYTYMYKSVYNTGKTEKKLIIIIIIKYVTITVILLVW